MMEDKSFDLYGTCVLYDIFRATNTENLINNYVFSCTPLCCQDEGIKIDANDYMNYLTELPKDYIDVSNFRKKNKYIEITHSSIKVLQKNHSKYLLLDAIFAIYNLIVVNDNIVFNILEKNIIKCLENHDIIKINKEGNVFDIFTKDDIKRRCKFFCDSLLKIYPPERIIFFRVNFSQWLYSKKENTIEPIDQDKNAPLASQVKFLEESMLENLPGCHVVNLPEINIANKEYTWGTHPLHYIDETYMVMYKALNNIIENDIDNIDLTEMVSVDNCKIFHSCYKENIKKIDYYRKKYLFLVWKDVVSNLLPVLPDSIDPPTLDANYDKQYVQFFIKGHPREVHYEIIARGELFYVCVHCEIKIHAEKYEKIFKSIDDTLNTHSKKLHMIEIQSDLGRLEKDLLNVMMKTLHFFLKQEQS